MKPILTIFELGHAQAKGLAGGDVIMAEMSPFLADAFELHVVVPELDTDHWRGRPAVIHEIPDAEIPNSAIGIWTTYRRRAERAAALVRNDIPNPDLVYSSTDVWPDVRAPFLLCRTRHELSWIGRVHHLIPLPIGRPGSFLRNVGSYLLQQHAVSMMARRADRVYALNDSLRPRLLEKGIPGPTLRVLGAGIPRQRINDATPDQTTPAFDAVFVGRLHRTKGVLDLPAIWTSVRRHLPIVRLAVIGDGEEREALESLVRRSGLAKTVRLLGFLPDAEKWKMLKRARLFLAPDREAGFGLAIAEAMACGLPVVAWDLPAYRAVFRGGLAAAPLRDEEAFAHRIVELLANDDERKRLATEGRVAVSAFDWSIVAKSFRDDVLNLLTASGRRR